MQIAAMHNNPPFSRKGILKGFTQALPIAMGVFAYGVVYGVLAGQTGLSLVEALLMSGIVFAGSSQFVALELWVLPLPVITIVLTTWVMNLRHVLMGAAIRPWLSSLSPLQIYSSAFFITDENWALTMRAIDRGEQDRAFLLGSGLTVFIAWLGATFVGRVVGVAIQDPSQWGLDFAFTAVFTALLLGMWKGKSDLFPWVAAGIVALAAAHWLPGKWYILCGGLAGSLVGAVRDGH